MSYTEVFAVFENGDIEHYDDLSNANKGAALIWTELCAKYNVDDWLRNIDALNQAYYNDELSKTDSIVMATTFTRVIFEKKDFSDAIDALNDFIRVRKAYADYNDIPDIMSNLRMQVETLEALQKEEQIIGVCFNVTSVNEACWIKRNENGNRIPYNIYRDSDHYFYSNVKRSFA